MTDDELKATLAASWDAGAVAYDTAPRHGLLHDDEWVAWRRLVAAILGDPSHSDVPRLRVLDVGTGTGILAILAAQLGHTVTGIDLSSGMLDEARRKAAAAGLAIQLRSGDAEALPADLTGFDAVLCRHVLWTLPDPRRALDGWRAATRPGGLIAIIDGFYRPTRGLRRPIVSVAGALVRRRERRHTAEPHDYAEPLYARLPLARQRDTAAVATLLRATGLEDVRTRPLPEVDRVERAHLDPLARVADRWARYIATGRVPRAA